LAERNSSSKNHLPTDTELFIGRKVWIGCSNAACCGAIPSNLAEGRARRTTGEFIQFISHAEGSVAELDTQLILGCELRFSDHGSTSPAFALIEELRRMLNVLRRKLIARE